MVKSEFIGHALTCPCGKLGYRKRSEAKAAGRRIHPGERLTAYQCKESGLWHIGHLPYVVARGIIDRRDIP